MVPGPANDDAFIFDRADGTFLVSVPSDVRDVVGLCTLNQVDP